MIIGYAITSIDEQNLDVQVTALEKAGCEKIFIDKETVGSGVGQQYLNCLNALNEGDILVIWKVALISPSLSSFINIFSSLIDDGVHFRSLTDEIDTTTPEGRDIWKALSVLAKLEHSMMLERTRSGVKAAQERGVKFGRREKLTPEEIESAQKMVVNGSRVEEVADFYRVNRATMYRKLKKYLR